MSPFPTRFGVPPEVQLFFRPFYHTDAIGNLVFSYGNVIEHFGFAFHKVPVAGQLWMAGNLNLHMVSDVFLAGSAMDAIAFLTLRRNWLKKADNILFVSVGTLPQGSQLQWIRSNLGHKKLHLLFDRELLGKIIDLKIAAGLHGWPMEVTVTGNRVTVNFRNALYTLDTGGFSLHAFEKAAGYRFTVRTHKSNMAATFIDHLMTMTFNH
ncbi:hypothetical protein PQ469_12175 [Mucilaginibacter sp. KACC 22773]|uniref:hypothetical protein n=1 Tax=Mucilaginibacter sp. KACC 22773 TaxID=3025671 RepID=UPI002366D5F9|nr:hypothetical protein [Mucilaginibacter sp. KACC 22773]WDF80764.1 hypothetical protein PQ469_12175 [Mucilaginibacter sp. KACC 22773]